MIDANNHWRTIFYVKNEKKMRGRGHAEYVRVSHEAGTGQQLSFWSSKLVLVKQGGEKPDIPNSLCNEKPQMQAVKDRADGISLNSRACLRQPPILGRPIYHQLMQHMMMSYTSPDS